MIISLRDGVPQSKQSPHLREGCFLSPLAGRCTGMLRNRKVRSQRHVGEGQRAACPASVLTLFVGVFVGAGTVPVARVLMAAYVDGTVKLWQIP